MKINKIFTALFVIIALSAQAQKEHVISDNAPRGKYGDLPYLYNNVNISNDSFPQNEPSVKFNARYPDIVLTAWRDFRMGVTPAVRRIGYSRSTDKGTTWSVSQLIPVLDTNHPFVSDPVVCSDTNGNFYVSTITATPTGNLDLLVFKSTDAGLTFTEFEIVQDGNANNEDKEWMVCDVTKGISPYKNHLYIAWTRFGSPSGIVLSKSSNGGINWTEPIKVSHGGVVQGPVLQ